MTAKADKRQLSFEIAPIDLDGEVLVRHQGGHTQTATLFGIEANEVHLKFGLAGVRVAVLFDVKSTKRSNGLTAGHFRDRKMAFWRIDNLDLERLRTSAKRLGSKLEERVKEERYGKKENQ